MAVEFFSHGRSPLGDSEDPVGCSAGPAGWTVSPQLTPLLDRLCSEHCRGGSGVAFLLTKHLQASSQPTSAEGPEGGRGEVARAMGRLAPLSRSRTEYTYKFNWASPDNTVVGHQRFHGARAGSRSRWDDVCRGSKLQGAWTGQVLGSSPGLTPRWWRGSRFQPTFLPRHLTMLKTTVSDGWPRGVIMAALAPGCTWPLSGVMVSVGGRGG